MARRSGGSIPASGRTLAADKGNVGGRPWPGPSGTSSTALTAAGEARHELPAGPAVHGVQSHGAVEDAVKVTKSLVRTLQDALEFRLGTAVPDDHGLLSWLVRHAVCVSRRILVGPDGRTSVDRYIDGACGGSMVEFGERIWWMPLQRTGNGWPAWGARFEDGWYLGSCEGSRETLVLTPAGVVRTRTLKRRPTSERWTKEMLTCTASEVEPNASNPGEARIGIRAPVAQESERGFPPPLPASNVPFPRSVPPRRAFLYLQDFLVHGLTPGCLACERIRGRSKVRTAAGLKWGNFRNRQIHSVPCRERMEALLAQDTAGKARLRRAERRLARYAELKDDQQAKRSRTDDVGRPLSAPRAESNRGGAVA